MGKFYMERPIDSTQELVYTIADSSKIVFVDGISNVKENYFNVINSGAGGIVTNGCSGSRKRKAYRNCNRRYKV